MEIKWDWVLSIPSIHSHFYFFKAQNSEWVRREESVSLVLKSLRIEVTIWWQRKSFELQVRRTGSQPSFAITCCVTVTKSLLLCGSHSFCIWKILESQVSVISRELFLDPKPRPPEWQHPILSSHCLFSSPFIPTIPAQASQPGVDCLKRHMAPQCSRESSLEGKPLFIHLDQVTFFMQE